MNSDGDRARNLAEAGELVAEAAADGAEFVVLPEKWPLLGSGEDLRSGAEPVDGPAMTSAAGWAAEHGIYLLAGSFAECREGHGRLSNTSILFDPKGGRIALYRKIHLFDVDLEGTSYRESETEEPGTEIVNAPLGDSGFDLGMTICFDLRFPELYRILALRGANFFAVPAAFTAHTGRAHWEVLLRARAIENHCFVAAANQVGTAEPHYESHGSSMICDPWGSVLARVEGDEPGIAVADCDLDSVSRSRGQIPVLESRRPDHYDWPDSPRPSSSPAKVE